MSPSSGDAWRGGGEPFSNEYYPGGGGYYPGGGGYYPGGYQGNGYDPSRGGYKDGGYFPDYENGYHPNENEDYYNYNGSYFPEYHDEFRSNGPASWMPWDLQN
ncbi:MAG: hypothetical protein HQL70_06240 [Magnetococcales bacterium]|nr:hypothetical protein [Magnetococcales bacterium]